MSSLKIRSAKVIRTLARSNPSLGRLIHRVYRKPKVINSPTHIQTSGKSYILIQSRESGERSVGIYLRGACDLPAMFSMAPMIRKTIKGSCCIVRDPIQIAGSRSDFMLEVACHDEAATDAQEHARERLSLRQDYFKARLFEPTFEIPNPRFKGVFPKTVVVLSLAPDFSRTLYRHRRHGFLVDPGGFWLSQSMDRVLTDMSAVKWFNENFESVGRLTVGEFRESFASVVERLQSGIGARVLVFNLLTVDPGEPVHSYRLIKQSDTQRRREFNIALAELSAQLDFDILDVDRILKRGGVRQQVDFAHFSEQQFAPVALEGYRILREREVL
ncbi:MAG TPA: SGNH/GDSL hydrolase family protein [Acidimicrobiia bacterium]|nr:SGNH/GDSL hydrolase family protein [Acidimicrobiia bacterium]